MNKSLKRVIVSAMALSLLVPAVLAPKAEAAAKPKLSAKSVKVIVGAKKKVTVKKVKAKKIKKTTWSLPKKGKKIVSLSAKKKTGVTLKGKKAGKTTLTAKVKVGKKTYKLKTKITVVKKTAVITAKPIQGATKTPATTVPENTATAVPTATSVATFRPLATPNMTEVPKKSADSFATTKPEATIDPATKVGYNVDFEDVTIGTKTEDAITGDGIKGVVLRGHKKADDGGVGTSKDYLDVVDGSDLPVEGNNTHVLHLHREDKTWQGPMMNITDKLDEGCTYELKADVFCQNTDLICSYQEQTLEELSPSYGNFGPTSGTITKIPKGKWNTVTFTISVPDDKFYYALYFESYNGNGNDDIYLDNITLTKTLQTNPDKTIASLKDTYKDVFPIVGVGAGIASILGKNGSEFISQQYNAVTPGNEMKPDAILGSTIGKLVKPTDEVSADKTDFITVEDAKSMGYIIPDNYTSYDDNRFKSATGEYAVPRLNFDNVDKLMKAAHENGVKLRGHTLVWHQQTPKYFFQQNYKITTGQKYNTSKECMDTRLEFYVKTVMNHVLSSKYADCLYSYDVVNEYLHSANAEKDSKNITYWGLIYGTYDKSVKDHGVTLRPSYVKDAFKYAHEMLVKYDRLDVKLIYNDYNCYQNPENIIHLVDYINSDGKVCDGIGMQSHLDITDSFHSATNYAKALEYFRLNCPDLEIQITELDATMVSTEDKPLTDEDQAAYYDQIMNAILTNKKNGGNITALIIWSLYDGVSWRPAKFPCLFNGLYMPKAAFYAVIDAKKQYWD